MNIEITSLLDILVILLAFLLNVYSGSNLELNLVEDLKLPPSESSLLGNKTVIIQVDRHREIWIDGRNIGGIYEWEDEERIAVLFEALAEKRKSIREEEIARKIATESNIQEDTNRRINIVLDEELPYDVVHKVMHTSALAGFTKFKFIVQGYE